MNSSPGPVTDRTAGETRLAGLQERCSNIAGFKAGFCGRCTLLYRCLAQSPGPLPTSCSQTSVCFARHGRAAIDIGCLSAIRNRWRTATVGRAKQTPICKNVKRDCPVGRGEVCWPAGEKRKPAWLGLFIGRDGQIKVNQVIIAVDQI